MTVRLVRPSYTQYRGDRGYNKLAAPSDRPPCAQLVSIDAEGRESAFGGQSARCGKPSAYTIRRPGFSDFFLCAEHGEGWR